jgi:hypothetical protein
MFWEISHPAVHATPKVEYQPLRLVIKGTVSPDYNHMKLVLL